MNYDEQIAIDRARENKVVKDNKIIQKITKHKYELTTIEQKMVGYIISMIKPPEEPGAAPILKYEFDIRQFCKICGIDYNSGGNYVYIRESLKKLHDNSFWINEENGGQESEVLLSWIESPRIYKKSGKIQIRISEDMIPYLYELQERFTSYELYQILALKSGYSIKLYELLSSYAFTKRHTFDIEELKNLIQCPHKEYKDVRRYAIEPAVKEINQYTNLFITWEPITKGRKVLQIAFKIEKKNQLETYEAYRKTTAALNGVKHQENQLNIFEFMGEDNG